MVGVAVTDQRMCVCVCMYVCVCMCSCRSVACVCKSSTCVYNCVRVCIMCMRLCVRATSRMCIFERFVQMFVCMCVLFFAREYVSAREQEFANE
jgi:hypothetical protein